MNLILNLHQVHSASVQHIHEVGKCEAGEGGVGQVVVVLPWAQTNFLRGDSGILESESQFKVTRNYQPEPP